MSDENNLAIHWILKRNLKTMHKTQNEPKNLFYMPIHCRIYVDGVIDECMSERFGGLHISILETQSPPQKKTLLEGTLRDQTALIGVIMSLYETHLPLLSVEVLK
jgi:hypothetical protein